ncbi:MAG: glucokinase [Geminicoccaceae bacterium]
METDRIAFTNSPWTLSVSGTQRELGVARLAVINDFVAQALAVPQLGGSDVEILRPGEPLRDRPIGVIGPGTGLGVAGLIPLGGGRYRALPTEGGHASLAPGNRREQAVLERLAGFFPHVSKERLVSGPGLLTLAKSLAELDGAECAAATPQDVGRLAAAGDGHCLEATRMFSALLGAAAGDLALTYGARGGIYICGGVCLNLGPLFDRAAFAERFLAKGRMRGYLEPIPVWLVCRSQTGLLGAARFDFDDKAG